MPVLRLLQTVPRRILSYLAMLLLIASPALVLAQIQQGATVTVLRGEITIIRPDGSAVQPAPSGSTVSIGDEIRTIGRSGALVTFFAGTEIELGAETILVVERLSKDGDRIDISLRQVLGASVNRVQTLAGSGSTYQIQAGGAVALVRGTTFALVGPVTTSAGDVVSLACLDDCTSASTFAGCAMGPYSGYGVVSSSGKVASDCVSYGVDRSEGLFDAAIQGVTTTEQKVQGDTRGVPAGQVAAGQRQEAGARTDQQANDKDRDLPRVTPTSVSTATPTPGGAASPSSTPNSTITATPTPTRTATPSPSPTVTLVQSCNTQTKSGGAGTTTTVHQLGKTSGAFKFDYQAYTVPDQFRVVYEGNTLFDSGSVSGGGTITLPFSGSAATVTITVIGPSGTGWDYIVNCPP